ncbi:MAG: hypothetical protein A2Z50_02005 [Nitrospirae bacterium RBG_19FT_COMBO_42_15]|nr:MAG: hypothetical protein A2Z50_02005 [Nitrospirae bacterium RBG_19FT_COMBO_42_15]
MVLPVNLCYLYKAHAGLNIKRLRIIVICRVQVIKERGEKLKKRFDRAILVNVKYILRKGGKKCA